ncbi:MAG TPA: nucleotidyltransferase domain-containing protein, partial [Chroococcales cyanobacterium]
MKPDQSVIDEVVNRIVETVHPLKIILFGSGARGELDKESDLDVLVVMPEPTHCRQVAQSLHRAMQGIRMPVDILVAT